MKQRHSTRVTIVKTFQYLVLILMFLLLVGPFVWELSLSFKGRGDNVYAVPPYLIPKTPTLDNYRSVFKQVPVFRYIINTLIVAVISIAGNVIFSTMAGYALGRLKWKGRSLVYSIFIGTMVIPLEGVMISQFIIIRNMNLQNTLLAVALPGLCGAINILLMTNAFKSIPKELEESAMVDGANLWQRFLYICVPQVKGTMTVIGIFAFVGSWNDFLWPLIVISDEKQYTLTLGMNRLKGMFIQDPRLIAAGALVSLIPIIIMFCCFQKYFFRGLEQGGIKG
ncbi:binding-protein-dependent transport systems inner membrane component [Gardnerella vaginalis 55152]|jgi:sugar ABC superfamily ATP binding cassette transporter, membrane protein|uniref:Binding-protein-dependent transport systems inner membrane component n=4 Tax=Gardnerella vaginalis TaxID=2702 RepID=I4LW02_GARVA|nr:carbohydrate ABC transporter permease [Gardnerella vaginalis]MCT7729892.1 carbohydrate ABC transporter permease [Lactobacillus iners]EIK80008.1 binding-protein-dependent transport systems inner membrane component [Gardnerella vaginalis 1400E]EIK81142.1 binding-protein-dependent transport systems inner membrane component [Gardnerella vaginalis 55152]EPI49424.1 ABC transporter, permease protein [Gardnerella vaginalis JCP8108]MDK7063066.1 carbohydrate ABC transporter permease [Gardnerella vagi